MCRPILTKVELKNIFWKREKMVLITWFILYWEYSFSLNFSRLKNVAQICVTKYIVFDDTVLSCRVRKTMRRLAFAHVSTKSFGWESKIFRWRMSQPKFDLQKFSYSVLWKTFRMCEVRNYEKFTFILQELVKEKIVLPLHLDENVC